MSERAIEQSREEQAGTRALLHLEPDSAKSFDDWKSRQKAEPAHSLPELTLVSDREAKPSFVAAKTDAPPAEHHTMSSRVFSWGWTFDIKDEQGRSEGVVDQKMLHLRKTFEYKDANDVTQATGKERLFSWGTKIDVTDSSGKPIGGFQEEVFKSWWHPHTIYSIVDDKGNKVATSEKVEFLATDFTLTNNKGETIAKVHRPWLNWVRENWQIDIQKPGEVDKRILYMIPAYKTSADADRRAAEEEEQRKKDEEDSKKDDN